MARIAHPLWAYGNTDARRRLARPPSVCIIRLNPDRVVYRSLRKFGCRSPNRRKTRSPPAQWRRQGHSLRPFGMTDDRMTGVLPTVIPPLRWHYGMLRKRTAVRRNLVLRYVRTWVGRKTRSLTRVLRGHLHPRRRSACGAGVRPQSGASDPVARAERTGSFLARRCYIRFRTP